MNNPQPFAFTGYAREYGTFIGLLWTAAFASYAQGIQHMNTAAMCAALIFMVASPVQMCLLGRRLHNRLPANVDFKYLMSYIFSLQMLMFASLLFGLLIFCYFALIDQGGFANGILSMLNQPDVTMAYREMGMSHMLKDAKDMVGQFAALSPLQISLSLFNNCVMTSLFMAAIVALFVRKSTRKGPPARI